MLQRQSARQVLGDQHTGASAARSITQKTWKRWSVSGFFTVESDEILSAVDRRKQVREQLWEWRSIRLGTRRIRCVYQCAVKVLRIILIFDWEREIEA